MGLMPLTPGKHKWVSPNKNMVYVNKGIPHIIPNLRFGLGVLFSTEPLKAGSEIV
jgi:hypothetical protein